MPQNSKDFKKEDSETDFMLFASIIFKEASNLKTKYPDALPSSNATDSECKKFEKLVGHMVRTF